MSFMRKRDKRKLEEEHSGQITGIHRLPLPIGYSGSKVEGDRTIIDPVRV